jgi:hypothetical protein
MKANVSDGISCPRLIVIGSLRIARENESAGGIGPPAQTTEEGDVYIPSLSPAEDIGDS